MNIETSFFIFSIIFDCFRILITVYDRCLISYIFNLLDNHRFGIIQT